MKKIFSILLVLMLFLTACMPEKPIEEQPEEPTKEEYQLPSEYIAIKGCVYKAENGKFGVYNDDGIIKAPEYDEYRELGRVGGTDLYALGKTSGTKPWLLFGEDEKPFGVGERERVLFDIYSEDGKLVIPISVDDMERYDKETLFASLDGSFYMYSFSDEGEIIEESCDAAGKTGEVYNGLEEICYSYGASPFSKGYGLMNDEGKIVVPPIYTSCKAVFSDRIIAIYRDGFGFWNTCRLMDNEGNILSDKYHNIEYYHMGGDSFVGVASVANPQSQVISVCYDDNGEMMAPGSRFVDKDGKELSEAFAEDIVSAGGMVTDTSINISDYLFTAEFPIDQALIEWAENLRPQQVFETEKEYPLVIGEIFDILMESEEEVYKSKELKSIVSSFGDENEFCVHFNYVTEADPDCHLMIRVRKNEDGKYSLLARGGGPLAIGLEESGLTLEDIR